MRRLIGTRPRAKTARDTLAATALGVALFIFTSLGLARWEPPFAAMVQVAVVVALGGWWSLKAVRREGLARSPVSLPLALLAGSVALSGLFSLDVRLSLPGTLGSLTFVLFFFVISDLLLAGWPADALIDSILVLGTLVICQGLGTTVSWYLAWWQIHVPEYPAFLVPYRLYGVADHPVQLASLINLCLPFASVRLARSARLSGRLAYGLWLAGAVVVLFFSRARAGWIAASVVVATTVCWLALQSRPPRWSDVAGWVRRTWRIWLVTAGYAAFFMALVAFDARSSPSEYNTNGGSVSSLAGRPLFWNVAWQSFVAHPLAGGGPLTYPYTYVNTVEAIRGWVSPHAHNLFLNALAEGGTVGLLALVLVLATMTLALIRGWRFLLKTKDAAATGRRALLLCVSAALLGSLIHAQVDLPFWLPTNALVLTMLLPMGLQAAGALKPGARALPRWRLMALAAVPVLVMGLACQNRAQEALQKGIGAANRGDWSQAARALDEAVADDPSLSFYEAQRGYAYGVLVSSGETGSSARALGQALESYERALKIGPEDVPDLLNTAWLLKRSGSVEEADQALAEAVERGADWALPALLLGDRCAAQGKSGQAEALFKLAFNREAQAREMAACQGSTPCREAARRSVDATLVTQAHDRAQALLAQDKPEEALAALQAAPVANRNVLPWLDRADAYVALGQLPQARYALAVAWALGADGPAFRARAALSQARFCLVEGRTADARAFLERAACLQMDGPIYSYGVFYRFGLPGSLLPSLDMLQRTSDDLAVYRELAELYAQEGRSADAAWAQGQASTLAALLGEGVEE